MFRWFHTRATAGFLRFANGATRLRCGILATVYGPERVNEPRLEYKGRRYAEDGDERIPNGGERWPE